MPNCICCDTKHDDKYLTGTDDYFNYGKSGHKIRDYPLLPIRKGMVCKLCLLVPVWVLQKKNLCSVDSTGSRGFS